MLLLGDTIEMQVLSACVSVIVLALFAEGLLRLIGVIDPIFHTKNNIVEWLGVILLFFFGITMIIQGHFIIHGKFGYRHSERENKK